MVVGVVNLIFSVWIICSCFGLWLVVSNVCVCVWIVSDVIWCCCCCVCNWFKVFCSVVNNLLVLIGLCK